MKKIILIFFIAFVLRLLLVGGWYAWNQGERLSNDSRLNIRLAESLRAGQGFQFKGIPSTRRPPLYPLFIALFSTLKPFPLGIYFAHAFLGAASCVLLYFLGRMMFDERAGLLASSISAVYPPAVRQTVNVLPEILFLFLLLVHFYFLLQALYKNRLWAYAVSGAAAALAALTKEAVLFYVPLVLIWIFLLQGKGRQRLARAALFALTFGVVVSPWIVRNTLLHGELALITTTSGQTLYLGNNVTTVGGYTGGREWRLGKEMNYDSDNPQVPRPGDLRADRLLRKMAVQFIFENPDRFFKLTQMRLINMWRPYQTDGHPFSQGVSALFYLPVLLFGLFGILRNMKRWGEFFPLLAFIGYLFLVHAVTLGSIRYRYPIMPVLTLFAASTMAGFVAKKEQPA